MILESDKRKLVCISNNNINPTNLTIGKIYNVILRRDFNGYPYYAVINDIGYNVAINIDFFCTIEEYREKKLNTII